MNLRGEKMERIMQEIWKEVLKLQKMPSIGDSFFDLGGNSFLAVQVIAILFFIGISLIFIYSPFSNSVEIFSKYSGFKISNP